MYHQDGLCKLVLLQNKRINMLDTGFYAGVAGQE
jgi:hypothetical protein